MYAHARPNLAEASPIAFSTSFHLANSTVRKGYAIDVAQTSTRHCAIDYLRRLERLVQVPRLQLSCEVRATAHTTHGGIR